MKAFLFLSTIVLFFNSCADFSSLSGSNQSSSSPNESAQQNPDYTGPVADFKLNCSEAQFVVLLNLYRQQNGLGTVQVSRAGVQSARWHTQDMINQNYFSHTEPSGRSFSSRAASFGYSAWAENIAAGSSTAAGTFCQWKNSPGHNTNMLQGMHRTIGIGLSYGGTYGAYWENIFGPDSSDTLSNPLTNDSSCDLSLTLPSCS